MKIPQSKQYCRLTLGGGMQCLWSRRCLAICRLGPAGQLWAAAVGGSGPVESGTAAWHWGKHGRRHALCRGWVHDRPGMLAITMQTCRKPWQQGIDGSAWSPCSYRILTRGCPDFWWNFKTFISKLHNLFPSQSIFNLSLCYHVLKGNYPNKFLSRSKTSAFRRRRRLDFWRRRRL